MKSLKIIKVSRMISFEVIYYFRKVKSKVIYAGFKNSFFDFSITILNNLKESSIKSKSLLEDNF